MADTNHLRPDDVEAIVRAAAIQIALRGRRLRPTESLARDAESLYVRARIELPAAGREALRSIAARALANRVLVQGAS